MLAKAPMTTILPVVDLSRAREFYKRKLGLVPTGERPDGKFIYTCGGGATLALFAREAPSRADHTAVSFQVADIGATVRGLEERGVVFEDYDLPGLKTVNHVCVLGAEKAAWFRDPDGNYLCIHEDIG